MRKIQDHPTLSKLVPWVPFWVLFALRWRVQNIFIYIPGYGDVLEVLWGIQWYYDSIFIEHKTPFFTSLVFHPLGWHTSTLAHTPFFFLLALPFYGIGGLAFAYNLLSVLSMIVSFSGCFLFIKSFSSPLIATIAALVYTFVNPHWFRLEGHLHTAWLFGVLPWLALAIEKLGQSNTLQRERRLVIAAGLIWGLAINFSLYGIFMGALVFVGMGPRLLSSKRILRIMLVTIIALTFASPTILLYVLGVHQNHLHIHGVEHNLWWGASLNSLFIPSVFHPLAIVRKIARILYSGPYDESGAINLGLVTGLLALFGSTIVIKTKSRSMDLLGLTLTGVILGLGLLLRWNGEVISCPAFRPLTALIWKLGHTLKPNLFTTSLPTPVFEDGIPLPGLVLTAIIPFWESARTVSRFAFISMLGAVGLAAIALERFPKLLRYLAMAIWIVEALPPPLNGVPVPLQLHPAYAWLADRKLAPSEGILDLRNPTLFIDGRTIWATLLHNKPTSSGAGSFWPEHTFALWYYLFNNQHVLSQKESAFVFRQYGIRYIFLHVLGDKEREMWGMISKNPSVRPLTCFEPLEQPTAWPWPICVAEVLDMQGPINLVLQEGWSGAEDWGVWSEGLRSQAGWMSPARQDYRLRIGAFPLCVPDRRQEMVVKVNGQEMAHYRWQECELWESEILIPASMVRIGWNEVSFEYAYALSPAEVTRGQNGDRRMLSVGFTRLEVTR